MSVGQAVVGRRDPAARRTAVLAAARQLFIERGVDSTTVDDIAAAAQVAKGSVYLYFPSKTDIVAALEEQFETQIVERVHAAAQAAADGSDAGTGVVAWCAGLVDAYLDDVEVHDVLFYGRHGGQGRQAVTDNPLIADLARWLHLVDADQDNGPIAAFLVAGVTGLVDHALLGATSGRGSPDVTRQPLHDTAADLARRVIAS